jgi:hypothetical protein
VKTNPDRQFERGNLPQEKSQLQSYAFGWGENGQLDTERFPRIRGELTLDDTYYGRQRAILIRREKIKRLTLERRKEENLDDAA